jgi:asparagine synthase (glutamine-hydrolysing)
MCGIVGFTGRRNSDALIAMTRHMSHRGPDGEGFYENGDAGVNFGHRRLAIVDVAGGAQPMHNADSSLVVTFNGEIYNHLELRRELTARGHKFASDHSDTEVLLHGYKEWGANLPVRLNGMFAFAIHDRARNQLFLARDRFGEKPLYVYHRGQLFAFASELSALSLHPDINPGIDDRALQKYFAYGYIPGRNALWRDCFKLRGGSYLVYDLASNERRESIYWNFQIEPDYSLTPACEPQLIEELQGLLLQSVKRRLMSDVPLGLFLSGGIDSSAILASAAKVVAAKDIQTFTIGFDEQSYDESPYAQLVADRFGCNHRTQRLSLEAAKELAPATLSYLDEPLGDASLVPTFLLSRFTREHVTVALTGDGGDELFAGYDPFAALQKARLYERLVPDALHAAFRSAAGYLPRSHANMSLDFKIRRTLMGLSYPPAMWNPCWMSPIEPSRFGEFFENPLPAEDLYSEAIALWDQGRDRGLNAIDRTLEFFTQLYLKDDILTKVDRAGMANGLEARSVFIDNDIVAFCARLPHYFKLRNGKRKYLLKKAVEGVLPPRIVQRRKKGFGIPLSSWLRDIPHQIPLSPVPGMRTERIADAWTRHRAGVDDERFLLWCWLALQGSRAQLVSPLPDMSPNNAFAA